MADFLGSPAINGECGRPIRVLYTLCHVHPAELGGLALGPACCADKGLQSLLRD